MEFYIELNSGVDQSASCLATKSYCAVLNSCPPGDGTCSSNPLTYFKALWWLFLCCFLLISKPHSSERGTAALPANGKQFAQSQIT